MIDVEASYSSLTAHISAAGGQVGAQAQPVDAPPLDRDEQRRDRLVLSLRGRGRQRQQEDEEHDWERKGEIVSLQHKLCHNKNEPLTCPEPWSDLFAKDARITTYLYRHEVASQCIKGESDATNF